MLKFLTKKEKRTSVSPIEVDVHSHILPGLDDGAATLDDSIGLIRQLHDLGFRKLIATPHIMSGAFNNSPETIIPQLNKLREILKEENIPIELDAAAEYYVDDHFIYMLDHQKPLLTFGQNYVLIETGFLDEPVLLKQAILKLCTQGYKPVLAHPERYIYLQNNFKAAEDLISRGALLQLNLNSLTSYYSKTAKLLAEKLIEKKMITFAGTDCHHLNHIQVLQSAVNKKLFAKLLDLTLLNNTL